MSKKRTRPSSTRIMFVGANGEYTKGPLLPVASSPATPRRILQDATWNHDRAAREFILSLRAKDQDRMKAAMPAMDRLDCWRAALTKAIVSSAEDEDFGSSLLWFWITFGLRIPASLQGDLFLIVDALKRFLPPYSGPAVSLYRGECSARHHAGIYGISWTTDIAIAKVFANRRSSLGEGPGSVLRIHATAEMIIAPLETTTSGSHASWLGEAEYLVDPRLLTSVQVVD